MCLAASAAPQTKSSHVREAPSAAAIPFLQLLRSHIEHTLTNARLLGDLELTKRRLLRAHSELEDRVAARTRDLTLEVAERRRAELS